MCYSTANSILIYNGKILINDNMDNFRIDY